LPAATDGFQVGFGCPGYLDRPRLPPRMACQAASSTTAPRIDPMMPLGRRANPSPADQAVSNCPCHCAATAPGRVRALELEQRCLHTTGRASAGASSRQLLDPWKPLARSAGARPLDNEDPRRPRGGQALHEPETHVPGLRPSRCSDQLQLGGSCLPWWPFSRSFHQALLHRTRPDSTESRPNLTCLGPTGP
jgi:hypothetical protein